MLCCLVASIAVAGCQSNPVVVTDETIASRDARLGDLKPWRALGSLVVDSEQQGVLNASFTWEATAEGFDIHLIGPLGLKTYRITENTDGARVTGEDQEYFGDSAEILLQEVLGVRVPLKNMQDWVVGLQGRATNAERDKLGRIRNMLVTDADQARWKVNFQRYAAVDELELPKRILVSGDDVEIKLSIRSWSRPEPANKNRLAIPTAGLN